MSNADDHQRLLQILEAHGQQFLNSFEQSQKPSGSNRKLDDSPGSSKEDEEWHGFGSGDPEDENLENSSHGALQFIMPELTSTYERRM
jgi:hypothetical protein